MIFLLVCCLVSTDTHSMSKKTGTVRFVETDAYKYMYNNTTVPDEEIENKWTTGSNRYMNFICAAIGCVEVYSSQPDWYEPFQTDLYQN